MIRLSLKVSWKEKSFRWNKAFQVFSGQLFLISGDTNTVGNYNGKILNFEISKFEFSLQKVLFHHAKTFVTFSHKKFLR